MEHHHWMLLNKVVNYVKCNNVMVPLGTEEGLYFIHQIIQSATSPKSHILYV